MWFVSLQIAESGEVWWDTMQPDARSLWESKIELGEKFFQEIITNPVPLDLNILTALKRSPLGDLYLWLAYRTFALERPLQLTWRQVYRQFGVDPAKAGNRRTVDDFRKDCLREGSASIRNFAGSRQVSSWRMPQPHVRDGVRIRQNRVPIWINSHIQSRVIVAKRILVDCRQKARRH